MRFSRSAPLALSLAALALFPLKGGGQAAVPPLVDVGWLAQHIADEDLVLLHVGSRDQYVAAHIPGARLVNMSDLAAPHDMGRHEDELALELPDPAVARERLESLGISDDSHIVVYWGADWVSPATRVVFTLDWLGLGPRTSLLDGGLPAWTAAGHGATDVLPPPASRGRIAARAVRDDLVVDASWVRAHAGRQGFAVVDARDAVFYNGTEGNDRRGHVPGAVSIPYTTLVGDGLRVRDLAALRASFTAAGIEPGDVVAVYCHIGQQGTAIVFAARLLGHDARLYDGSFQDWSRRAELPVENPAESARR